MGMSYRKGECQSTANCPSHQDDKDTGYTQAQRVLPKVCAGIIAMTSAILVLIVVIILIMGAAICQHSGQRVHVETGQAQLRQAAGGG